MEIADRRVATIHYTLTNEAGEVIDQSPPQSPLSYMHGAGNIVPGLEKALAGHKPGDTVKAEVVPQEGYGPRHDGLVQTVPRSAFQGVESVAPGMQFEARTERGPLLVTVTKADEQEVTVDGNHPLAGQNLHFAVEVADVRDATEQELQDGQVTNGAGSPAADPSAA
ncbi:FKBP-type peptidyl-prolyl cis-trans isomerase [Lysobacter sp. D1-1-M9]|uniref:FKBP-type peptidyl-prolyl cis-trans isomerase n=1 Tax=Novilysobacter longmucuonensis TaxID=3098603 RepID=UPI002FC8793F